MSPIALTDSELHEVMQAAQMVPYDLRQSSSNDWRLSFVAKILAPVSCIASLSR
jgi:hypothetical protein